MGVSAKLASLEMELTVKVCIREIRGQGTFSKVGCEDDRWTQRLENNLYSLPDDGRQASPET